MVVIILDFLAVTKRQMEERVFGGQAVSGWSCLPTLDSGLVDGSC